MAQPRLAGMEKASPAATHPVLIGALCGAIAALFWATGFVAAKHGINVGMAPADLALHRFVWTGIGMTALTARQGFADLGGVGWWRGLALMVFAGPLQALAAYTGYTLVPLGHGAVIQPACAAVTGLLLATLVLHEHLRIERAIGALTIIGGLVTFGAESVATIGTHGLGGDFMFVGAGALWGVFGVALRFWSIPGLRAAVAIGTLAFLIYTPLHGLIFGYQRMIDVGLRENLLQAVAQGVFAGVLPIYLFGRAVTLLGAGRASVFPTLVPVFTMSLGVVLLGEIPSALQLAGLAIVLIGFRFAMK